MKADVVLPKYATKSQHLNKWRIVELPKESNFNRQKFLDIKGVEFTDELIYAITQKTS